MNLKSSKIYPVAEVQQILRKFGNQHEFYSAEILSKVLDIPLGTLTGILYSKSAKGVSGVTKEQIEKAIRNYDPSICPEMVIKKEAFAKVLVKFAEEFNLNKSELARVIDVPNSTLKSWMNSERSRDFRAKTVRPVLIKMREHRIKRGVQVNKAVASHL